MVKGTRAKLGYFPDNLDPPVLSEIIWIMPLMIWNCLLSGIISPPPPLTTEFWPNSPYVTVRNNSNYHFSGNMTLSETPSEEEEEEDLEAEIERARNQNQSRTQNRRRDGAHQNSGTARAGPREAGRRPTTDWRRP